MANPLSEPMPIAPERNEHTRRPSASRERSRA
jgi:hypothetical protein